jgi:HELP motif
MQAQEARNNLYYGASTDDILYHSAAVGIKYSITAHSQLFSLEHTVSSCT